MKGCSKHICPNCVGEEFIKKLNCDKGKHRACSYCSNDSPTLSVEQLADKVEPVLENNYWKVDRDVCVSAAQQVQNVVAKELCVADEIANDVASEIRQRGNVYPDSGNFLYIHDNSGIGQFGSLWHKFENCLTTKSRFFSPSAKTILDEIFGDLSKLNSLSGASIVTIAGPGGEFQDIFRARVFGDDDQKLNSALRKPWIDLAGPPSEVASAGRMNAHGISVFYGAKDELTAIYEARPPVGSKVVVAEFSIQRTVRLLNITSLKSVEAKGSSFDPSEVRRMERANFLRILSERMSRPVMPNNELFEYLPTQAVADYLATEADFDGIIYPSVQRGHRTSNVALFHHAARVEEEEVMEGKRLSVEMDVLDNPFGIVRRVWEKPERDRKAPSIVKFENPDTRPETLKIKLENVTNHYVKEVKMDTESFIVPRDVEPLAWLP
ncbi:MAG: RES family NAD+ phosphorylase [Verrucomicrobiales bacterium]|nr:RES family NAD+ phosphorylase [Verrucomicrobiales bacterium]